MQTKWTLMGLFGLFLVATLALAQSSQQGSSMSQSGMSSSMEATSVNLCRGSSIIGAKVVNAQGEDLGKIHDVVLNSQRDQVNYAVLAHGGVAGVGEKMIAIPWSEFQVQSASMAQSPQSGQSSYQGSQSGQSQESQSQSSQSGQQYSTSGQQHQRLAWNREQDVQCQLSVSKDQLSRVQGFKSDAWPEQASANWQQQTTAAEQPKMSEAQKTQFETRRLSKIIGTKVESSTPITFRETSSGSSMSGTSERSSSQQQSQTQSSRSEARQDRSTGRTEIGKIKDCVLNADNGRCIYGVVSLSDVSGHTNELSAVPWDAIRIEQRQGTIGTTQIALLQITNGDNLLAFTFQPSQQPDLADRNYLERVYTAYNVEPQWEALGFVPPSGESRGQQGIQQQQRRQQMQQQLQQQRQQRQQQQQQRQSPSQSQSE